MGVPWGFDGAFGTDVRPPHVAATHEWARDESAPGANDGTRLTASVVNRLLANIRKLAEDGGAGLTEDRDDDLSGAVQALVANAIAAAVADVLVETDSIALLSDGGGFVRMTDAERSKLASLVVNFKGVYVDLAAVAAAHPSGQSGWWAILTQGGGAEATIAIWDTDESPAQWIDTLASAGVAAHTHPISDITGLQTALDGKASSSHSHAISDVTGLQTAIDAKAPLASPSGSGTATWPTINATTALQKKGISGKLQVGTSLETWTTGFTSSSGTDVEAWLATAVAKVSAAADAATLHFHLLTEWQTSRSGANTGVIATVEYRTHDGSSWGSWTAVRSKTMRLTAGGVGSTDLKGELTWLGAIDLTNKTQWQLRINARVETTGSTPSFTLIAADLIGREML